MQTYHDVMLVTQWLFTRETCLLHLVAGNVNKDICNFICGETRKNIVHELFNRRGSGGGLGMIKWVVALQILTRTRWRRVKTLGQHQVGVNLQSHAQHQLWISTWHIFHEFHKIMPSLSYPVSLVNQNVILVNISHWRLHMAWIMSLMST